MTPLRIGVVLGSVMWMACPGSTELPIPSPTPTVAPTPTAELPEHVVVVGIDGLAGHDLERADTPNLDALMAEGVWTLAMQNVLPTLSSTNWASAICGVGPDQHGVLSNAWQPGDSELPTTLFAALREHRPEAKIGVFHEWAGFGRLVEPGVVDRMEDPGDAQDTTDAAIAWLRAERPDLVFVHLDNVDTAGHSNTWESDAYRAAVEEADAQLGQIVAALREEGLWEASALVVLSDHGGVNFTHGDDTRFERSVPFIARAPGARAAPLTREIRIWDAPTTVLELLGVPRPAAWFGSVIVELLNGSPTHPKPQGRLEIQRIDAYRWVYDTTASGALADGSIWRPTSPEGFALLGDVVVTGHGAPTSEAVVARDQADFLVAPVAYERIWDDRGSDGDHPVSVWNPVPPLGFTCLGSVATAAYDAPPALDDARCVHQSLLLPGRSVQTWNDTGTGAAMGVGLWTCHPDGPGLAAGGFTARRDRSAPGIERCFSLDESRLRQ
jgi:hypothetical protein